MEYKDLDKQKKTLRKQGYSHSDGKQISRESLQAKQFVELHKKAELARVLKSFETEAMADLLDLMVLDYAMIGKERTYRDYKTDLVAFVKQLRVHMAQKK